MKKLLAFLLVALLCIGMFTACGGDDTPEIEYDVESAAGLLKGMYEEYIKETELTKTLELVSSVKILDVSYDVVWTTDNAKIQITKDTASGKTLVKPCEKEAEIVQFKVIGTITNPNDETDKQSVTLRFFVAAKSNTVLADAKVTELKANTAYKLYFTSTEKGKAYYLKGGMSGYYMATSENITDAVDVFVEIVEGGYKLYYMDTTANAKAYLSIEKSSDGKHTNAVFKSTAADAIVLKADAENNTLKGTLADGDYYFGTYGSYVTIGASAYENIGTGYPCHLATMVDASTVSDADKVAKEKTDLNLSSTEFAYNATLNLPSTGKTYTDVKITWAINSTVAKIENGKLVITLGDAAATAKLTATIKLGSATETKEFDLSFAKKPTLTITDMTAAPEIGKAYKLYVEQGNLGQKLFFTGIKDGNYLGTTDKVGKSANVYFEDAGDGKYYLYTDYAGAKKYISIVQVSSYINALLLDAPNGKFTYDTELKTVTAEISTDVYYLGTSESYATLTPKKTSDDGTFVARFATVSFAHEYTSDCDVDCDLCGATRKPTANHTDANKDFVCDVCEGITVDGGVASLTPTDPVINTGDVVFDFSESAKGDELTNATALALFNAKITGDSPLKAIIVSKAYQGNTTTSGAFPDQGGFIKVGTTDTPGMLVLAFNKNVSKIQIVCHDWYAQSANYPNNSNHVSVNGSDAVPAPYYETAVCKALTFTIDEPTNVVQILITNRVFIEKIIVTLTGDVVEVPDLDGGTGSGGDNTGSGDNTGDGTVTTDPEANSTLTVEQVIALGSSKEHNVYTEGKYYVTGVITEVYNTQYGNMKITDGNGNILTIYGTFDADGTNRYDAMAVKPVAGDTITVYGIVGQYSGTPQVKNAWITAHTPADGGGDNTGSETVSGTVEFDFSKLENTASSTALSNEQALTLINSVIEGTSPLQSVIATKIYHGNSSTSGAFPSNGTFIKTGTNSAAGQLVLTFNNKVAKIEIVCHDWFKKSDTYPTNSNTVSVNGSEAILAPYTEDATLGTLTFELAEASETVTIDTTNRIFIKKIIVTFADASGDNNTGNGGNTGDDNTGDGGNTGDDNTGTEPETPAGALEIGKGYTISATNGKGLIYVISTISSGRFNGTYTAAEATVFYVEAAASAGEYLLYFMDGTTKTYVVFGDSSSGASVTTDAAAATPFEWNDTAKTLAVADDANNRAFAVGATSTYDNFSSYDLTGNYNWGAFTPVDSGNTGDGGNTGGDNTGSGDNTGDGGNTGTEPEAPAGALEIGKGYTISATNGKGLIYVISTISSGRFNGTYTAAEATVFYVEAAASAGEYLLYFMDGTTKTYVVFGDSSSGASVTTDAAAATPFEWNDTVKTLAVADDANNRAFAVGATSTYDNFSSYDLTGNYNWGAFTPVDSGNTGDDNTGDTPILPGEEG